MTERKDEECMQSTDSSGASLSLEHLEPGLMRTVATSNAESSKPSSRLDMSVLNSFLIESSGDAPAEPYLEIVEQPKQKDLRFRYECEGRSAGSLLGIKSTSDRKTHPTVKIKNYTGKAKIVVSLVTRQSPHQLHPNGLVGKLCKNGICTVMIDGTQRTPVSFPHLGIQCAKKKDSSTAVQERLKLGVDPFNQARHVANSQPADYEMNVVCLCFEVFLPDPGSPTQFTRPLPPKVSDPIYDKRGASVIISRVDLQSGTVCGGDEMFILCEKVQKDDIEVVFFKEQWEGLALFGPSDIHRQVAIVCRTPPFEQKDILQPVTVQFKLRRKSDQECSEPVDFIYKPIDLDADGVKAKKRKKAPQLATFFRGESPVKQEPPETGFLQYLQQQQQQQQQQIQHQLQQPASASADQDVRMKLRSKLEQSTKQPNANDSSLDATLRSREYARAVRTADRNQSVAKFSPDSSTFNYSDRSNMSSGTVLQMDTPAANAGATYAAPLPRVPALPFQGVSVETGGGFMGMLQLDSEMAGTALPPKVDSTTECTGTEATESSLTSDCLSMLQYASELLQGDELERALSEQMDTLEQGPPVNLEELTTLQDFDPRTMSLMSDVAGGGGHDFTEENVHDSVSLPYSHSVELGQDTSLS